MTVARIVGREEVKNMSTSTMGTYYFEDGYIMWVPGLSANERAVEIRKHGKIVKFVAGK